MKNKTEEEIEEQYQANLAEALEDAELKGFRKGCVYTNTLGEEFTAEYDPIPWDRHRKDDPVTDVFLECGCGHGLILNEKKWGSVIKK